MDAYAVINGLKFVQVSPLTITVTYSAVTLDGSQEIDPTFDLELPENPALWRQAIMDAVVANALTVDPTVAITRFLLMDLHTLKA